MPDRARETVSSETSEPALRIQVAGTLGDDLTWAAQLVPLVWYLVALSLLVALT